jgi:hypothetical protein
VFESTAAGPIPLSAGGVSSLLSRDIQFRISNSLGVAQLTGIPLDIAFDNLRNFGGLPNPVGSQFSAGSPVAINGKNLVRGAGAATLNTNEPTFMFLAVPSSSQGGGVVDVIDLETNLRRDVDLYEPGTQSISADGATLVMDYFRQ